MHATCQRKKRLISSESVASLRRICSPEATALRRSCARLAHRYLAILDESTKRFA
jgi:hypothetical protein